MAGERQQYGVLMAVAAFAGLLLAISPKTGLAAASAALVLGFLAWRPGVVPTAGLLAVAGLVPLGYLGSQVAFGAFNSATKLVFLPAFGALLLEWSLGRRRPANGGLTLCVLLFGLVLGVSYLAHDPTPLSRPFLLRLASMILLYLLCVNGLRTERDLARLFAVMAGACTLSAVGSFFRPVLAAPNAFLGVGGLARMTGWATDDAPTFGTYLLVALLICLYFAVADRRPWFRLLLILASATLAISIVHTFARGITLAMLASAAYLVFRLRRRIQPLVLAAAALLVVLALLPFVPEAYWERMGGTFTHYATDPTMVRRADTYRIGLELFRRSPLLGYGPGNFVSAYMAQEFRFERSPVPSVCFNLYLSILTQAGLLGLAAFGGAVACAFRELRKAAAWGEEDSFLKRSAELLEIVLVALLLVSLFEPTDLLKYLWIALGAASAVGRLRRERPAAPVPAAP